MMSYLNIGKISRIKKKNILFCLNKSFYKYILIDILNWSIL